MDNGRTPELSRFDGSAGPRLIGPNGGKAVDLGSIGARMLAWTEETGGHVSVLEHPMPPRRIAAPVHKHSREDEYSFVLEGRMGALLGDEVVYAEAGDFVFKPREQWHTFWNPADEPARILEIIAPAGFEHFFSELVDLGGVLRADPAVVEELCARYELEMQPDTVPGLAERFGLRIPQPA